MITNCGSCDSHRWRGLHGPDYCGAHNDLRPIVALGDKPDWCPLDDIR